jgi:acetoin utilization protein AcuC
LTHRTALIISPEWDRFSFGDSHPFDVQRHTLALALMEAYGLTSHPAVQMHPPLAPCRKDLLSFHTLDYLDRLIEFSSSEESRADFCFGLGDADNPVFKGMYEWACLGVGGTMAAAKLVTEGGYAAAFNLAG